jgi:hypothetical protein
MRFLVSALAGLVLSAQPLSAQIRTVDPNLAAQDAAQADVVAGERGYETNAQLPPPPGGVPVNTPSPTAPAPIDTAGVPPVAPTLPPEQQTAPTSTVATQATPTYKRDDLMGAAEGVFGKGAAGLAGILEKILKDQGEPNAYVAGREISGAFAIGLRYGSGTMQHKVEGQRPVYWTGPSIGFDVGGDATKVFTLVYNLYDSQELYRRYPQVEGRMYYIGGFSATYLRRGSVVLIPVRLGVGVRLGANIGYMKFSEKSRWLPF